MSDRHSHRGDRRPRYDDDALPSYGKSMPVEPEVEEMYLHTACRTAGVSFGCAIKFCGGTGSLPALIDLPKGLGWRGSKDCAAVRLWISKILHPVVIP